MGILYHVKLCLPYLHLSGPVSPAPGPLAPAPLAPWHLAPGPLSPLAPHWGPLPAQSASGPENLRTWRASVSARTWGPSGHHRGPWGHWWHSSSSSSCSFLQLSRSVFLYLLFRLVTNHALDISQLMKERFQSRLSVSWPHILWVRSCP